MSRYINVENLESTLNALWNRFSHKQLENPLKVIYNNNCPDMCKDLVYQVFLLGDYKVMNELQNGVIYEYCYELQMNGFVERGHNEGTK